MSTTQLPRALGAAALITLPCLALAEPPNSASALEFGDATTLFVADSVGARILAYTLPAAETDRPADGGPYNLDGFGSRVARLLDVPVADIRYQDLAVQPETGDAYVALSTLADGSETPAIVVARRDGTLRRLDLDGLEVDSVALGDVPDDGVTFWRDVPASSLAVTDMDYSDGELFVAGVATGEFASTLRRFTVPFDAPGEASGAASASVEIYHAVHDQSETRAPIRAMAIVQLDGEPTVIAAYTCTPLVSIPTKALSDGAHVRGKTIGELGYGNTPLEVVSYTAYDAERNPQEFVLVINRELDADLVPLASLEAAVAGPGLSEPVGMGETAGVETMPIPMSGVFQAADQDPEFLLTLKRNLDTGDMDLVSIRKGVYLRLSDFVSEYDFPDYAYDAAQLETGINRFQNMLRAEEGYPELVR